MRLAFPTRSMWPRSCDRVASSWRAITSLPMCTCQPRKGCQARWGHRREGIVTATIGRALGKGHHNPQGGCHSHHHRTLLPKCLATSLEAIAIAKAYRAIINAQHWWSGVCPYVFIFDAFFGVSTHSNLGFSPCVLCDNFGAILWWTRIVVLTISISFW